MGRTWARRSGSASALSTGAVAAALLGSEERLEYTLVGDTVNLAQRLQDLARPAGCTVFSEATCGALPAAAASRWASRGQGPAARGARLPPAGRGGSRLDTGPLRRNTMTDDARRRPGACARLSRPRGRPCGRCAASTSTMHPGRVRRGHGAVGLRQVDAAQPRRGARHGRRRRDRARRRGARRQREDELAIMRRKHIGIVFQFFNLLEGMSVLENVVLPAVVAGAPRKRAESRARDLLDLLGLADKAKAAPGRALGRPAPAAGDRPRAGQRADAAARRRAHRRARLRRRPRGAGAVPAAARRRPDRSCWSPTTTTSPTPATGSCACATAGS